MRNLLLKFDGWVERVKPTRQAQDRWIMDYVKPILEWEPQRIPENYRRRKREAREDLRNDMLEAGVFDSLDRLETDGTSWERVEKDLATRIEYHKSLEEFEATQKSIGQYVVDSLSRRKFYDWELGNQDEPKIGMVYKNFKWDAYLKTARA